MTAYRNPYNRLIDIHLRQLWVNLELNDAGVCFDFVLWGIGFYYLSTNSTALTFGRTSMGCKLWDSRARRLDLGEWF